MEPEVEGTEESLHRTFSSLTVDDVYEIAKIVGSEVEKLIDRHGKASVEGLVPKIVKVLELLESFAAKSHSLRCKEEDLLKAFETLQVQQQKKRGPRDYEDLSEDADFRDWQQKEQKWRLKVDTLQAQVLQLQEENQELLGRLQSSHSKEDRTQRQEREVMLKLKEVVDKQRDELRAKVQEISGMSKEVEALQEQLERFMKMNGELRQKQSMMQAQLKSAMERRVDMEADLSEMTKEIGRLTAQLEKTSTNTVPSTNSPAIDPTYQVIIDLRDPNRPCFTKQEVRDMIFERNELKANLFLVQEELAYYQREILNEERCPGFLLEAVRATIKKQRMVIKAKMLGIPVDECNADEESGPLFEKRETEDADKDCTDSKPAESRIRNLFGFLTRSGSGRSPSHQTSSSAWEIINPDEQEPEEEAEPRDSL